MIGFWGRIEMDIARMRYRELLEGERHQQQLSGKKRETKSVVCASKIKLEKAPRRSVRVTS